MSWDIWLNTIENIRMKVKRSKSGYCHHVKSLLSIGKYVRYRDVPTLKFMWKECVYLGEKVFQTYGYLKWTFFIRKSFNTYVFEACVKWVFTQRYKKPIDKFIVSLKAPKWK